VPLVSVLTSGYSPTAQFLEECWRSLTAQEGLGGWEWEWVLQEDGNPPCLHTRLPDDPRISYAANGERFGIAATRNLALSRARGDVVQVLDQDDLLMPTALGTLVDALARHPDCAWSAGDADDLHADGERERIRSPLAPGRVAPGTLTRIWKETGAYPIHCAGVMLRIEVARALGGWFASARCEDVCLVSAVSTLFAGAYVPETTFLYRRWGGQTTGTESFRRMRTQAHRMVRQRVKAIETLSLRPDFPRLLVGVHPDRQPVGHGGPAANGDTIGNTKATK
jgi:glycosyltransferase involved in cell wall biosynthesis